MGVVRNDGDGWYLKNLRGGILGFTRHSHDNNRFLGHFNKDMSGLLGHIDDILGLMGHILGHIKPYKSHFRHIEPSGSQGSHIGPGMTQSECDMLGHI